MKFRLLLLTAGCAMSAFGAYAQKGVDNGTRFGSGEDSIRCITNISLFAPYAKAGNYKDAYEPWKAAYTECPAATKDIYLYGVKIMEWLIKNETDATKKAALIDDLMAVYDQRVKYFGDDKRYRKDWIVARKAQDYMQYKGTESDYAKVYGWLKEVVDEFGNSTDPLAVSSFAFASMRVMMADPNKQEQYIQDYLKASDILNSQLKAAEAAGSETTVKNLNIYISGMEDAFAASGAADCETLQNLYADKIEQNKSNIDFLKQTIALLRRSKCQEIEAYFAASGYAHAIEPTAESAVGLAKQAYKKNDYDTAIKFFTEAANMETDNVNKSEDYYLIGVILNEKKNYPEAKQNCLKALEANPNNGAAHILLGTMYAASAQSVYPNDAVLAKCVYYAAIEQFEKAKQADESLTETANKMITTYRGHLPSNEDIFMHPDIEKGKSFTIGGWIGERVTIR